MNKKSLSLPERKRKETQFNTIQCFVECLDIRKIENIFFEAGANK